MHVIPLITMANICAVLLPPYHIRSPGVYFLKMILTQHLSQSGVSSGHQDAGASTVWIPLIDETLQVHSA